MSRLLSWHCLSSFLPDKLVRLTLLGLSYYTWLACPYYLLCDGRMVDMGLAYQAYNVNGRLKTS